jgi:hypothetical protein
MGSAMVQCRQMALAVLIHFVGVAAGFCASTGTIAGEKKLIEWGWDQPNTAYLREHIREMEQAPFDGVVLAVEGREADGKRIDFTWQGFGKRAFAREQFEQAVADLKATEFRKFTDNFLRFNVTPGDVDWFDDEGWKSIFANSRLIAEIAREGRLAGLLFDLEQYNTRLFDYPKQPRRDERSFDAYAKQIRKRGAEVMRAINAGDPELTLLLPVATSNPFNYGRGRMDQVDYGLLPAFVDGLLEAATSATVFVDGLEMAYPVKERSRFGKLREIVRNAREASFVPELYDRRMTIGFGLWMDHNWRKREGWFPAEPAKNYFSPAELRAALRHALDLSDRYVWLYSEQINWWTGKGLTPEYVNAVREAKEYSK